MEDNKELEILESEEKENCEGDQEKGDCGD